MFLKWTLPFLNLDLYTSVFQSIIKSKMANSVAPDEKICYNQGPVVQSVVSLTS